MSQHVRASALRGTAVPRALVGSVRADGANAAELIQGLNTTVNGFKTDFKNQFDGLQAVVNEFKASNDLALKSKADVVLTEKVDRLNSAIDAAKDIAAKTKTEMDNVTAEIEKISSKVAGLTINGVAGGDRSNKRDPRASHAEFPAYAKAFDTYFRKGDKAFAGGEHALRELEVKASMNIGSDPDGGYTVLPEIEQTIDEVVKQVSPMRDIATVRQISTNSYRKLVNLHGTNSAWVGEAAARPTTNTPTFSELTFPVCEVYAMPGATQSLLDDAFIDIGQWLAGEVQLEFAQKEGAAFVSGDGVLKPSGFLGAYPIVANASYAWGKIGYIGTGTSGAYGASSPADCLIDLYHGLNTAYRNTAVFVANRGTLGTTRKLKDGQGNYLLNMVFRPEGFLEEILGRPAIEMPDMPDIAANSYSVAFGDFKRGYLIVDRIGIRVLRDPYTAKPFVLFYTTKRVGGGVSNFEAIKLLKFI